MKSNWRSRFAENVRDYEGYPIGKTLQYLTDPEIISLAGGLPSPEVFQRTELRMATEKAFDLEIDRIMQYSPCPGEATLVDAVLRFLERDNIHIGQDNIVITTSGQHGLDLTGRLFLEPGDVVLVDRPTFAGAVVAFNLQRARFVGVNIEDDGSDVIGMRQALDRLHREGTPPKFIYVVPDFQNPSGITISLAKREALLDLSYEYDIPIVEDSPYRDLRYVGETIPAIFTLDQQRGGDHVIGLYTFSKLFCPGMRVGFNIGPAEVVKQMTHIKEGNILNTPKWNQDMCRAFLEDMDLERHLENCRSYYREKLDVFLETMAEHFPPETGVRWTKPEGGLFLWVSLPPRIDTDELFFEAIEHKVAFVPGEQFYGENPERNHMRINFSFVSKEQLAVAVERLAACIKNRL
ncbi:MAG: PLP-dependent aminotransferase family protein [Thermoanaerobaculales bacterium]|nr:PLP-dependent aminotransferase family protein [Thermoanaerobaculales bacterium]